MKFHVEFFAALCKPLYFVRIGGLRFGVGVSARIGCRVLVVHRVERQEFVAPQVARVPVVHEGKPAVEVVLRGLLAVGLAAFEQEVLRAAVAVGVGHVHQIALSVVHRDDVPHMFSGTRTPAEQTRHQTAFHVGTVEGSQVAEELKRFGIALTDYICLRVAVKDAD